MESNQRISELLIKTRAYSDLDKPVILTSGELGIYYINTEKLCQDGGEFKKYGEESSSMVKHAVNMMQKHPTFKEVINILTEEVDSLFPIAIKKQYRGISGGQRRDWLFSGPVAAQLKLPHISLYKKGKVEVLDYNGKIISQPINDFYVIHIVDLITEGSSVYRVENREAKGWVPMLRNGGSTIKNLVAVVTRLQGGEENLKKQGVTVHPFVAIDQDFVKNYSNNPERAIAYMKNPEKWSENYLRKNGALDLIETFDPEGGKFDRAKKFLSRYGSVLQESGKMLELESAVHDKYGKSLHQIIGSI